MGWSGRSASAKDDELTYLLRLLRDTARDSTQQVGATMDAIREQLEELQIAGASSRRSSRAMVRSGVIE